MNKYTFLCSALIASVAVNAQNVPTEAELYGSDKPVKRYAAVLHEPDARTTYAVPTTERKKTFKAPKEEITNELVVFEENFDKFTGGTEDEPDMNTSILDMEGKILPQYVNASGWSGDEVYMAGQTCCIAYGEWAGGSLTLPSQNLTRDNGNFVIKFRARCLEMSKGWLEFGHSTTGNFFGKYDMKTQAVTDQWAEYSLSFEGGSTTSFIQIYLVDGDKILIDDIRIIQSGDDIPAPNVWEPSGVSPTGFTANWEEVIGADHYLLNAWHLVIDPDHSIVETQIEDFSGLEIKDGNFVNLDKNQMDEEYCLARGLKPGWSSNIGMYGNYKHYYNAEDNPEMVESAPYSLCFDAGFDNLYTAENLDKEITYLSFKVKSEELVPENDRISVLFKYKDGGEQPWDPAYILFLADYPGVEDEFIEIYMDEEYIPAGVCQAFLQFNGGQTGEAAGICAIDDVEVHYGRDVPSLKEYIAEDLVVKGETSYSFSDLVENDTYYYDVRAVSADGKVSLNSKTQKVPLTFTSLSTPTVKEATNITKTSFDANWTSVAYAGGYALQVSLVHTAPEDQVYTLCHETFDYIPSNALPEDAVKQDATLLYLSEYCNRAGWSAFYPYFAEGMAGTGYGMNSPTYNLSHNDGNFTIDVKLYGADGDTILVISNDLEGVKQQQRQECIMDGTVQDFSLEFSNGSMHHGITLVPSGEYLLVDEIKIQQKLKQGDMTSMEFVNGTVVGDYQTATVMFYGCEKGDTFSYRVAAWGYDTNNKLVTSKYSDYIYVDPKIDGPVVGIENVESPKVEQQPYFVGDELNINLDEALLVEVYNLQGMLVKSVDAAEGLNTIKVDGDGMFVVKAGSRVFKVMK